MHGCGLQLFRSAQLGSTEALLHARVRSTALERRPHLGAEVLHVLAQRLEQLGGRALLRGTWQSMATSVKSNNSNVNSNKNSNVKDHAGAETQGDVDWAPHHKTTAAVQLEVRFWAAEGHIASPAAAAKESPAPVARRALKGRLQAGRHPSGSRTWYESCSSRRRAAARW